MYPVESKDKEMDVMEMENRIHQFREDLPGDVVQSAKLVLAAFEKKWSEVETLLEQDADPRICRRGDAEARIIGRRTGDVLLQEFMGMVPF